MRFLPPVDWRAWCSDHQVPLREAGWVRPDFAVETIQTIPIPYPKNSGAKVALARFLFSLVSPRPETMLLIDDWSVWPSSEHLPLLTRFRQALGEARPLIECPGHLVTEADGDDAVSIISMSLLFIWDCYGISSSGRDAFYLSHDEYCNFMSRDAETISRVRERLSSR
jgi:hypothetical protein